MQMLYGSITDYGKSNQDQERNHVYLGIVFESIIEARRRAALLLALTWRPVRREGAYLQPIAATSFGKALILRTAGDSITDGDVRLK